MDLDPHPEPITAKRASRTPAPRDFRERRFGVANRPPVRPRGDVPSAALFLRHSRSTPASGLFALLQDGRPLFGSGANQGTDPAVGHRVRTGRTAEQLLAGLVAIRSHLSLGLANPLGLTRHRARGLRVQA